MNTDSRERSSLVIVGCGIKFISHLTTEAKAYIEQSDKVLYLINEPAMKEWIQNANPNTESLERLSLSRLSSATISRIATLYIPPAYKAACDESVMKILGIKITEK